MTGGSTGRGEAGGVGGSVEGRLTGISRGRGPAKLKTKVSKYFESDDMQNVFYNLFLEMIVISTVNIFYKKTHLCNSRMGLEL